MHSTDYCAVKLQATCEGGGMANATIIERFELAVTANLAPARFKARGGRLDDPTDRAGTRPGWRVELTLRLGSENPTNKEPARKNP